MKRPAPTEHTKDKLLPLLDLEREARNKVAVSLRELSAVYSQILAAHAQQDRALARDPKAYTVRVANAMFTRRVKKSMQMIQGFSEVVLRGVGEYRTFEEPPKERGALQSRLKRRRDRAQE